MFKAITLALAAMFVTILSVPVNASDAPLPLGRYFSDYPVNMAMNGANYAGYLKIDEEGCGTNCRVLEIRNLKNNASKKVTFAGPSFHGGVAYQLDSNLLIVNTFDKQAYRSMSKGSIGEQFTEYYRWNGSEFEWIFSESWNDSLALEVAGDEEEANRYWANRK